MAHGGVVVVVWHMEAWWSWWRMVARGGALLRLLLMVGLIQCVCVCSRADFSPRMPYMYMGMLTTNVLVVAPRPSRSDLQLCSVALPYVDCLGLVCVTWKV